ncbi:MAG: acetate/propionate family kinase [Bacteroidetes bacterium]|nr:acetate/propionate family kinase [Bacteroidota bacterium]
MHPENKNILAVNGGSSSIKFSLYTMERDRLPSKLLSGKIDRVGKEGSRLTYTYKRRIKEAPVTNGRNGHLNGELPVNAKDAKEAASFLLDWLETQGIMPLAAIGHRVVHGLQHKHAAIIDDALLTELKAIVAYDPDHLPGEIDLIELFRQKTKETPQIACFDTAFHAGLPRLAKLLPIPRRYDEAGVQRYGFHGLSYAYILEELTRIDAVKARGSVIIAHLGSGASLAAIKDGVCVDTTMGFTPTGGIVMGTRTGDLDPGVIWYLLQKEQLTPEQLNSLINHESGLLGVSATSGDMQDLLNRESSDERAAEAVELFCYQVKKAVGAFSAVLGGVDALVFTGGIGERSPVIRSRVCAGLDYLGIDLDQKANGQNAIVLAAEGSRTAVYAIPTDEEWMIARTVDQLLNQQ